MPRKPESSEWLNHACNRVVRLKRTSFRRSCRFHNPVYHHRFIEARKKCSLAIRRTTDAFSVAKRNVSSHPLLKTEHVDPIPKLSPKIVALPVFLPFVVPYVNLFANHKGELRFLLPGFSLTPIVYPPLPLYICQAPLPLGVRKPPGSDSFLSIAFKMCPRVGLSSTPPICFALPPHTCPSSWGRRKFPLFPNAAISQE